MVRTKPNWSAWETGADNIDPEFDILRDEAFFRAHEADFMRDYPGKFVAIRGEEIFGVSNTRRGLIELAYQRFGGDVYFFARQVCPESFLPPEEWVRVM